MNTSCPPLLGWPYMSPSVTPATKMVPSAALVTVRVCSLPVPPISRDHFLVPSDSKTVKKPSLVPAAPPLVCSSRVAESLRPAAMMVPPAPRVVALIQSEPLPPTRRLQTLLPSAAYLVRKPSAVPVVALLVAEVVVPLAPAVDVRPAAALLICPSRLPSV